MISEREKQKNPSPQRTPFFSSGSSPGHDLVWHGRRRRPGEAVVRDLDQSPPFKPARLQARANQRQPARKGLSRSRRTVLVPGRQSCLSPSLTQTHGECKIFCCCCLPASALSWRLPQISNDWARPPDLRQPAGNGREAQQQQTRPWRLPSGEFLSEFFSSSLPVRLLHSCWLPCCP